MKIAHIVSTFPPYKGGMGNSVYHFVQEMAKLGHSNVIFTPAYDASMSGHEDVLPNVEVVRLPALFSIGNAAVIPQLMWKIRDFDIIHLHYPFYGGGEALLLGLLFSRAKLMLHYHMDTIGSGIKGLIFRTYAFFFLPIVARIAKLITCASIDYVKHSDLSHYYKNHSKKFVQVPFGVDDHLFSPGPKLPTPTILFVGGLDQQHYFKGVDQLIDAFAKLAPTHAEARLLIVGKGDLEEQYQLRIKKHGLEKQVSILNSVSDTMLSQLYQEAWVTVLPSLNRAEAFGLVLLESLASGTAVIASNLPGVRNVFRNGAQGYLVKPGDVDDLSEKLQQVITSQTKAITLGLAGRSWVEHYYSWKKSSQRLEAAYCRVLYTPKNKKKGPLKSDDED